MAKKQEIRYDSSTLAQVAKLVSAHDSKSCSARSVGSTPTLGTMHSIPADVIETIRALTLNRNPKIGSVLFIAVDGHGGSGKTTFALLLSKELGSGVVQQDDFASWENPLDWWPEVIEKIFRPIADGAKTISYPRTKWWPGHTPEPVADTPVTNVMILEGVSSLRKEFRDYVSIGIFVDTPDDICLRRGIERDMASGEPREKIEALWQKWLSSENEYFSRDNPKHYADIIVDGNANFKRK